jgi:hypothetical protein
MPLSDEVLDTIKVREPKMLESIFGVEKQYQDFSQALEEKEVCFSQTLEVAVKRLYSKGMSNEHIAWICP